MAFGREPEPADVRGLNLTLRWIVLACGVGLFGVMTDPVQQATSSQRRMPPSETSAYKESPPLERIHPIPRTKPTSIRPPSRTGHLLIPAIGVDSPLIPLGVTSNRTLEVPKDYGVAGWFTGGPFPGEPGPAVVAGHVDSISGPAVFYRLRELQKGDVIVVSRKGGLRSRFRVESLRWFSKSAFPTDLVYGFVDTPVLRLITCGGAFDSSAGHYVDNLVVFASPMTDS
jgi:sortase (surface protein transpeptidase)